jgi:hypothetical protein
MQNFHLHNSLFYESRFTANRAIKTKEDPIVKHKDIADHAGQGCFWLPVWFGAECGPKLSLVSSG